MANPATATCSMASCQTWEGETSPRSPIATSASALSVGSLLTADTSSSIVKIGTSVRVGGATDGVDLTTAGIQLNGTLASDFCS